MTSLKFANSPERHITAYDKIAHRSYTFKTSEITSTDPDNGLVYLRPVRRRARLTLSRKDVIDINRLFFAYACEAPYLVGIASLTPDVSDLFSSALARIG